MKFLQVCSLAAIVLAFAGCSGGDTQPAQAAVSEAAGQSAGPEAMPSDPIAAVAYDFMDAVFANDIARATQRLTPQAIESMQAQDKRFEWGAAAAKLETGDVRVAGDEAAVACFVTADQGVEELLCVLRKTGDQWRVYGVAWQGGDGGEPQVVNFEQLPPEAPQQQAQPSDGNRYVDSPVPQIPPLSTGIPAQAEVAEQPAGLVR